MSQSKPPLLPVVAPMPRCPVGSPRLLIIASPYERFLYSRTALVRGILNFLSVDINMIWVVKHGVLAVLWIGGPVTWIL